MEERRPLQPAGGVFVGRQREMAELLSAFNDAVAGQGRMVMLAGEPGVGQAPNSPRVGFPRSAEGRPSPLGLALRA